MAEANSAANGGAEYEYDFIVIGGGSGGLAASKEAAKLGARVACLDFVVPSPQGTAWGLGGTCVNVGCIPKKLMHTASLLGEAVEDAKHYGWDAERKKHDWTKMVEGVQDHIGSLNWGYRVALRDNKVDYFNALGSFVDAHTVECTDRKGAKVRRTAKYVMVAVGGRPKYPEIPGAKEHCITSDDLFSLGQAPGKTLVVGASYVALECAGFLTSLGYETTVMARSIFLRGFDQEAAEMVASYMEDHGTKMLRQCVPERVELTPEGRKRCTWKNLLSGAEASDEFDTILFAIGRSPFLEKLNIHAAGLFVDPSSGKLVCDDEDRTNVPSVFAIGDVVSGRPELTPVAIQAGVLLARRLFAGSKVKMDYDTVPTTIFTPLEYGCCGLSEEDAIAKYGEAYIDAYVSFFKPLEWTVSHRPDNRCYAKLLVHVPTDKVVGLHILAPNAGEITQGFALAMKCGATKEQFDCTVGIHPTTAEEFTTLAVTKRSGKDPKKKGC
eukprot:tig00001307_g8124.t1